MQDAAIEAQSPSLMDQAASPTQIHASVFKQRNRNLQWLRGVAALFVLLYHASSYIESRFGDTRFSSVFGHEFGLVGVAIFFAISGALMADILKTTPAGEFLIHRILRIYPMLLIASLILPFASGGDFGIDSRALSLVPVGPNANYRLTVEWTLVFELFFYVVLFFISALGAVRWLEGIAVGWILLLIGAVLIDPTFQENVMPRIADIPFLAASAAFAGGLLIPWLARRQSFQPALGAVALAVGAIAANVVEDDIGLGRLLAALPAVLLVGLAVSPEFQGERDTSLTRAATKLGDWSYALYLCHVPVIMGVYDYIPLPPVVLWPIAIVGSLALAAPLGMLDLRLYRTLRSRSDRSTPASFRRWAWIYVGVYLVFALVMQFKP